MKIVLVVAAVLVVSLASVGVWMRGSLAHMPWEFEAEHKNGVILFTPDLNKKKDHIYTERENAEIFKKVSLAKHLLNPDLGLAAAAALLQFPSQVGVGDVAPNFTLETTAGQTLTLEDLRGRVVVFMFAAMTCPPARSQVPRFDELQDQYDPEEVYFFTVYSRERHPEEKGYPDIKFAESDQEKWRNATSMSEITDLPIAVDGIDEQVLGLYGKVPNAAYVLDKNGVIAFRSTWADSSKVASVVNYLISNQPDT